MTRVRPARRGGFTLIELLVAIALAILLLSLVVGLTSSGLGSYRTVRSADRVSGWLLIAKSRAIRDGQPRGVRFFRGADGFYREAQYIEVPPPWVPNERQEANPTGPRIVFSYNTNTATPPVVTDFKCYYVSDNATDLTAFTGSALGTGRVRLGDVLVLPELGGAFRLTAHPALAAVSNRVQFGAAPTTNNASELTLASMPNFGAAYSDSSTPTPRKAALTTYKFGFTGAARPLFGEPLLQLSVDTAIDSAAGTTLGVNTAGDFDVVFAPSGQVVGANSLIALWVRDPTRPAWPAANAGEQVLIGVYPKTGLIATHPPAPAPADPYQYVKDGLSSGL